MFIFCFKVWFDNCNRTSTMQFCCSLGRLGKFAFHFSVNYGYFLWCMYLWKQVSIVSWMMLYVFSAPRTLCCSSYSWIFWLGILQWADVETLVKELQQIEGIQSVSRGRFFLSPGLAPAFQVYMASMFENQYKLLARSGNKVQEVIVQASLSKEEMKSTILSCTNRVE